MRVHLWWDVCENSPHYSFLSTDFLCFCTPIGWYEKSWKFYFWFRNKLVPDFLLRLMGDSWLNLATNFFEDGFFVLETSPFGMRWSTYKKSESRKWAFRWRSVLRKCVALGFRLPCKHHFAPLFSYLFSEFSDTKVSV